MSEGGTQKVQDILHFARRTEEQSSVVVGKYAVHFNRVTKQGEEHMEEW